VSYRRPIDVVIVTHRNTEAVAPQSLYLAHTLACEGLRVVLICTASRARCRELRREPFRVLSPGQFGLKGRTAYAGLYALAFVACLMARLCVSIDITALFPVACARRLGGSALVLYWLEAFYGRDVTDSPSIATRAGLLALRWATPPDALVDVNPERLAYSRTWCGNPKHAFVLRNVPPLDGWDLGPPSHHVGPPRLVYAGSVTDVALEGLQLFLSGMADDESQCTLTILPAEGRNACGPLDNTVRALDLQMRVQIHDRVPRDSLPATLRSYDAGIVMYPVTPQRDINSQFAAPNKLYEYMACGLAIITSNNPSLSFVARDGLGWLMKTTESVEVSQILREVCSTESLPSHRQNSYSLFQSELNYEKQAGPLLEWMRATLGPR
jgi:hypothetical protein